MKQNLFHGLRDKSHRFEADSIYKVSEKNFLYSKNIV